MQVLVKELTPAMTEVRVRMQNSQRSGGLASSGVSGYPTRTDYTKRLFDELSTRYATVETVQASTSGKDG